MKTRYTCKINAILSDRKQFQVNLLFPFERAGEEKDERRKRQISRRPRSRFNRIAMEDEDFGFTKRTDNVLKKVTVSNEKADDRRTVCHDEQRICSPPKVGLSLAYARM